jgi:hypothetical protein
MSRIQNFGEFVSQVNENENVEAVNEQAVDLHVIAQNSPTKEAYRRNLIAHLNRHAPSLAEDDNFVDTLLDNYTEPVKAAE